MKHPIKHLISTYIQHPHHPQHPYPHPDMIYGVSLFVPPRHNSIRASSFAALSSRLISGHPYPQLRDQVWDWVRGQVGGGCPILPKWRLLICRLKSKSGPGLVLNPSFPQSSSFVVVFLTVYHRFFKKQVGQNDIGGRLCRAAKRQKQKNAQ